MLKPGGVFGSLELGWFDKPPAHVYEDLVRNTCTSIIPRVAEFGEWESLFARVGLTHLATTTHPMTSSMRGMVKAEGVVNAAKVMARMVTRPHVRKRMMTVQAAFGRYANYLGYGISRYRK